jgi:NlpC/P60 family putative phage cell wall peptidase
MSDRGGLALAAARGWIGTPVRWEASLKGVGTDCRGLVAGVARELGWPEGDQLEARLGGYSRRIDEAALLAGLDRLFDRVVQAQAGDVLAFRIKGKVQHLAIHAGSYRHGERMVHAYMTPPAQVVEVSLVSFWQRRLAGAWRWREGGFDGR